MCWFVVTPPWGTLFYVSKWTLLNITSDTGVGATATPISDETRGSPEHHWWPDSEGGHALSLRQAPSRLELPARLIE